MKTSYNLSVHHIGGRAGTMEFKPLSPRLENSINRVLYDADESCIEQIEKAHKNNANSTILPYCISDSNTKENFYLLADRYGSSLIKPPRRKKWENFIYNSQFGWDLDMHHDVDTVLDLDVVSLDEIFYQDDNKNIDKPNYLSLDVEGAERKIFKGAKKLLKHDLLSLKCEFHSFEDCIKLIKYCKKFGFYVSNTSLFNEPFQNEYQTNIGLRGAQQCTGASGDITFLKKPSRIIKYHKLPLLDLLKIAFLSFVDCNIDKMYMYLNKFKAIKGSSDFINLYAKKVSYISFLKEYMMEMDNYPDIKILKYSHLFPTIQDRSDRFNAENSLSINIKELRKRYFKDIDKQVFQNSLMALLSRDKIGIETVCETYGFMDHANKFQVDRGHSMVTLVNTLGVVKDGILDERELANL